MPAPVITHADDANIPRLVCLHGGGTNARIFRNQCRSLKAQLQGRFRLVFVDAPFESEPGPDVESVYAKWGPFRSWVRWSKGTPIVWDSTCLDVQAVDDAIQDAVAADNKLGATGRIVGLLGFSQGAKMAGCLLLRQQEQARPETEYAFGVLIAGRGPLTALHQPDQPAPLLHLPTIHVHGLRDWGLDVHRQLFYEDCAEGTALLIEWDGDHRVPIKTKDVDRVVDAIIKCMDKV
ncbi:serine hydrolase FSH [Aspergillus unguis]